MKTIRFVNEFKVTESVFCPCLTQKRNNDSFGPDRRSTMPLTPEPVGTSHGQPATRQPEQMILKFIRPVKQTKKCQQ